jgi:hypothetical protein
LHLLINSLKTSYPSKFQSFSVEINMHNFPLSELTNQIKENCAMVLTMLSRFISTKKLRNLEG